MKIICAILGVIVVVLCILLIRCKNKLTKKNDEIASLNFDLVTNSKSHDEYVEQVSGIEKENEKLKTQLDAIRETIKEKDTRIVHLKNANETQCKITNKYLAFASLVNSELSQTTQNNNHIKAVKEAYKKLTKDAAILMGDVGE